MNVIFNAHRSRTKFKFLRRPFWDEWDWVGVALGRLTVRLWWTGGGSVGFANVTAFWPNAKHRSFKFWKYGLIHHVFSAVVFRSEGRDHYDYIFHVRLGRAELSIAHYRIAPNVARPDLWPTKAESAK